MSTPNLRVARIIACSSGRSVGLHRNPADNTSTNGMIDRSSVNRSRNHVYLNTFFAERQKTMKVIKLTSVQLSLKSASTTIIFLHHNNFRTEQHKPSMSTPKSSD